MGIFASDSFTDTAGDRIDNQHTPETGTWTKNTAASMSGNHHAVISDANRARSAQTGIGTLCYYQAAPAGAEYDVRAPLRMISNANKGGINGRQDTAANTRYSAILRDADGVIRLNKIVAGAVTMLGDYSTTTAAGSEYLVELRITDATKKVFVDGVERISSTDNAITAAGRPGLEFTHDASPGSNSTSVHAVEWEAEEAGGGGAISGSGASTLAFTQSGAGAVQVRGSGSATLTTSATGAGTLQVRGTGSALLELQQSGVGAVRVQGTGAATLEITQGGAGVIGEPPIEGTGAATLTLTQSGAGRVRVAGAGSSTLQTQASGAGTLRVAGEGVSTLVLSSAGDGAVWVRGAGGSTLVLSQSGRIVLDLDLVEPSFIATPGARSLTGSPGSRTVTATPGARSLVGTPIGRA